MGRMQNAFQALSSKTVSCDLAASRRGFQDWAICLPEPASHVMRTTLQHWESEIEEIPQIDIIHHCPTFFRKRLWECRSWSTHGPTDSFVKDRFHWHGNAPASQQSHLHINFFQPTHTCINCNRHGEDPLLCLMWAPTAAEGTLGGKSTLQDPRCFGCPTTSSPLTMPPIRQQRHHVRSQWCFPQSSTQCVAPLLPTTAERGMCCPQPTRTTSKAR